MIAHQMSHLLSSCQVNSTRHTCYDGNFYFVKDNNKQSMRRVRLSARWPLHIRYNMTVSPPLISKRKIYFFLSFSNFRHFSQAILSTHHIILIVSFPIFCFQFLDIGIVTSVEVNHKSVESARKGQEVCLKIEPIPGESPKMFGRHFDEKDILVSKVSCARIEIFFFSQIMTSMIGDERKTDLNSIWIVCST